MAGPSMFSFKAAHDLLQSFDVAGDPDSLDFLADLLASGTAPQDEVEALSLLGDFPGANTESTLGSRRETLAEDGASQSEETKGNNTRGKRRKGKKETGKKQTRVQERRDKLPGTGRSPFFDSDGQKQDEIGNRAATQLPKAPPSPTQAVAVIKTTTILYPESPSASSKLESNTDTRPAESASDTTKSPETSQQTSQDARKSVTTTITIRKRRRFDAPSGPTSPPPSTGIEGAQPAQHREDESEDHRPIPAPGTPAKAKTPGPEEEDTPSSSASSSSSSSSVPSSPISFSPFASKTSTPPPAKSQRTTTSRFFAYTPAPSSSAKRKLSHAAGQEPSAETAGSPTKLPEKNAPAERLNQRCRPSRGSVSALPFAPLGAPRFGLVQEELAHDPFWLLVALVFLVRVSGRVSLPVFWQTKARYPSAEDLADANPADLIRSMRHLGMASVRCAAIQRYARRWLERPPQAGVCTAVRNYPQPPEAEEKKTDKGATMDKVAASASVWEIGHLTQGAYAVDSWRIFCRDALLGLDASDDNTRQPEWMRVLPRDKELRAYLRWMWMREGWDWDPMTGERTVLGEELRCAVEEGRVGYDVHGQLQIVDAEAEEEAK